MAALVSDHEHHEFARPRLAEITRVPAIVLAETFSQLRRTFGQPADLGRQLIVVGRLHAQDLPEESPITTVTPYREGSAWVG